MVVNPVRRHFSRTLGRHSGRHSGRSAFRHGTGQTNSASDLNQKRWRLRSIVTRRPSGVAPIVLGFHSECSNTQPEKFNNARFRFSMFCSTSKPQRFKVDWGQLLHFWRLEKYADGWAKCLNYFREFSLGTAIWYSGFFTGRYSAVCEIRVGMSREGLPTYIILTTLILKKSRHSDNL